MEPPVSAAKATLPGQLEWKDTPHCVSALDLF